MLETIDSCQYADDAKYTDGDTKQGEKSASLFFHSSSNAILKLLVTISMDAEHNANLLEGRGAKKLFEAGRARPLQV